MTTIINRGLRRALYLSMTAALIVLFQNCGGAQKVEHTGGMTQDTRLSLDPNLDDQVQSIFDTVLGRDATKEESSYFSSLLASGLTTVDEIRSQLAGSGEAKAKVTELVKEVLKTDNEAIVNFWLKKLGDGASLKALEELLGA